MKSIYDIRQLLKKYGTYIYTGDRIGDLELMDMEIEELHQYGFIQKNDYLNAKLLIRKEVSVLRELKKREGDYK